MSQEILYTSAPQGLKPGSRGFCTVISTPGMSAGLTEKLESLSGYRQMFSGEHASLNPVNYSHLILNIAGRPYHVLSSIRDAGQDYTQRTNKLAHHVALEPQELQAGGPACALASPGFCENAFDGRPRYLPTGRLPPPDLPRLTPCYAWKDAAGDAGWAGVLAEAACQGGKPVTVIYAPGVEMLPLVEEALRLVPEAQRWKVTFSTYFTKLPIGVDCLWRFMPDGSPEAQSIRRTPHVTVIDLTRPLPALQPSDFVLAARTGTAPPVAVSMAFAQPDLRPAPARHTPFEPAAFDEPTATTDDYDDEHEGSPGEPPPLEENQLQRPNVAPLSPARGPKPPFPIELHPKRSGLSPAMIGVMGTTLFLLVTGGIVLAVVLRQNRVAPPAEALSMAVEPRQVAVVIDEKANEEAERKATEAREAEAIRLAEEIETKRLGELKRRQDEQEKMAAANALAAAIEVVPRKPFEEFDETHKDRLLELPRLERSTVPFKDLTQIFVSSPDDLLLELLGGDEILKEGYRFVIDRPKKTKDGDVECVEFPVKLATKTAGSSQVAAFRLRKNALQFRWESNASDRGANLRLCELQIRGGSEKRECRLGRPIVVDKPELSLEKKGPDVTLDLPGIQHLEESRLQVEVKIGNHPALAIAFGKQETLVLAKSRSPETQDEIELELKLVPSNGGLALSYRPFVYPIERAKNVEPHPERTEIWGAEFKGRAGTNEASMKAQKGRSVKLEAHRKEHNKRAEPGEREIAALLATRSNANKDLVDQRVAAIRSQIQSSMDLINREQAAIDAEVNFFKGRKEWCEKMAGEFEKLNGKPIHVEVYLQVGKDKVCLLKTE